MDGSVKEEVQRAVLARSPDGGVGVQGAEDYDLCAALLAFPSLEREGRSIEVPYMFDRVDDEGVRTPVIRYRDTLLRCPVHEDVFSVSSGMTPTRGIRD